MSKFICLLFYANINSIYKNTVLKLIKKIYYSVKRWYDSLNFILDLNHLHKTSQSDKTNNELDPFYNSLNTFVTIHSIYKFLA